MRLALTAVLVMVLSAHQLCASVLFVDDFTGYNDVADGLLCEQSPNWQRSAGVLSAKVGTWWTPAARVLNNHYGYREYEFYTVEAEQAAGFSDYVVHGRADVVLEGSFFYVGGRITAESFIAFGAVVVELGGGERAVYARYRDSSEYQVGDRYLGTYSAGELIDIELELAGADVICRMEHAGQSIEFSHVTDIVAAGAAGMGARNDFGYAGADFYRLAVRSGDEDDEEPEDSPKARPLGPGLSYENLAVGKFYSYDAAPARGYGDRWANKWTSGARLTDEEFGQDGWVGWYDDQQYEVEVVIDLGSVRDVNDVRGYFGGGDEGPEAVDVYTSAQGHEWEYFGSGQGAASAGWIEISGEKRPGRYVKWVLKSPGGYILCGQLEVLGWALNSWKAVPDWGSYFGAYPSDTYGNLQINYFENLIARGDASRRQSSHILWYCEMGRNDFADYLGSLWVRHGLGANLDYQGARYLQVGWEPEDWVSAEDIAAGLYDEYFEQFFIESIDFDNRGGNRDYVWFRPMSEMNGAWTFAGVYPENVCWGGDPLNWRRAWRRMFNIAEQVGAADHHIFLWSPNGVSYPDQSWNQPVAYYPGDHYVDWIGISVYPQGDQPYPSGIIEPFYDRWSHKPMMISEGAYRGEEHVDGKAWIDDWFDVRQNWPMIKAVVWFGAYTLAELEESELERFAQRADDAYFLRQSRAGRVDLTGQGQVGCEDLAVLAGQWLIEGDGLAGDISGDNVVDFMDFSAMSGFWLTED